jgi:hypothetical protein
MLIAKQLLSFSLLFSALIGFSEEFDRLKSSFDVPDMFESIWRFQKKSKHQAEPFVHFVPF